MTQNKDTLLVEIQRPASSKENPKLLRVIVTHEFTRIDFGYTTPWYYEKGGWIRISPDTYLQREATFEKFKLIDAFGISISPNRVDFESTEDWRFFSLYFEPIPKKEGTYNLIEAENPTPNDFNYYGIELKFTEGVGILG